MQEITIELLMETTDIDIIISALSPQYDENIRFEAIRQLGLRKEHKGTSALIYLIYNESNDELVISAIAMLGVINDEEALPVLFDCAKNRQNSGIKYQAIIALSEYHSPSVEEYLITQLINENDYIKSIALEGLKKIGGVKTIPVLINIIETSTVIHNEKIIISRMTWILGILGQKLNINVLPVLLKEMNQPLFEYTIGAIRGIGDFGDKSVIKDLKEFLYKIEKTPPEAVLLSHMDIIDKTNFIEYIKIQIYISLVLLNDYTGINILRNYLDDSDFYDPYDYIDIVETLVRVQDTSIISKMHKIINAPPDLEDHVKDDLINACKDALKALIK